MMPAYKLAQFIEETNDELEMPVVPTEATEDLPEENSTVEEGADRHAMTTSKASKSALKKLRRTMPDREGKFIL